MKHLIIFSLLWTSLSWSLEEVRGANVVLDLSPTARNGGLGGIRSGLNPNLGNVGFDPSSLMLIQQHQLELSHSEEFGGSNWDWIAWSSPIGDSSSVISLQFARYATDGIYNTQEGQIYEGTDIPTFGVGDYFITAAWARRLHGLDLGLNFHGIYRKLDQDGLGVRLDASLAKSWLPNYRSGIVLQGASSSAARWESGTTEYSPPELFIFQSFQQDASFFYGNIFLHWQSAAMIHSRANRFNSLGRSGVDQNPLSWLAGSQAAIEYQSWRGLSLRAGLQNLGDANTWTAGAGLELLSKFQVDYSLESHPELGRVNRISLAWFIGGKVPTQTPSRVQTPKAQTVEPPRALQPEESKAPQEKPIMDETPEVLEEAGEILEEDDEEILE